jgi:tRNA pseudouridine38/39 synthase
MTQDICRKIYNLINPGHSFAPACLPDLSRKLRALADAIDSGSFSAADPPPNQATITTTTTSPPATTAAAITATDQPKPQKITKIKVGREFDFSRFENRYIALELLYLGHDYGGFARQDDHPLKTIESELFAALHKTRLIPQAESWKEYKYSRGGRTDKGVSALSQVIALKVRSSARAGEALPLQDKEINYPWMLNRVLPKEIRVTGWADVPPDFSARFSAKHREYLYFFIDQPPPSSDGVRGASSSSSSSAPPQQLNIEAMQQAASYFIGNHDFRNFCKIDITNAKSWTRVIMGCDVFPVSHCSWGAGRQLVAFRVKGTAFLYHQVRCMAAILFMVGKGYEDPSIVQQLLDIKQTPQKPMYAYASEEPLLLHGCSYDVDHLQWFRPGANHKIVREKLEEMLQSHLIRAGILDAIQKRLGGDEVVEDEDIKAAVRGVSVHVKLEARQVGQSLEERLAKHQKVLDVDGRVKVMN